MTQGIKFEVGDILINRRWPEIQRKIIDIRHSGYGWSYLGEGYREDNYFWSENSTDPFFENGWERDIK